MGSNSYRWIALSNGQFCEIGYRAMASSNDWDFVQNSVLPTLSFVIVNGTCHFQSPSESNILFEV